MVSKFLKVAKVFLPHVLHHYLQCRSWKYLWDWTPPAQRGSVLQTKLLKFDHAIFILIAALSSDRDPTEYDLFRNFGWSEVALEEID